MLEQYIKRGKMHKHEDKPVNCVVKGQYELFQYGKCNTFIFSDILVAELQPQKKKKANNSTSNHNHVLHRLEVVSYN